MRLINTLPDFSPPLWIIGCRVICPCVASTINWGNCGGIHLSQSLFVTPISLGNNLSGFPSSLEIKTSVRTWTDPESKLNLSRQRRQTNKLGAAVVHWPEGADGRLRDFLAISGGDNGSNESLDAAELANGHLVLHVVARQVGEDPGGAGHDVDVVAAQQLHQSLHQSLHVVLQWSESKSL